MNTLLGLDKIKLTYIISDINKSLAFEWLATHLDKEKFDISFILLNDESSDLEEFLLKNKINVHALKRRASWKLSLPFFWILFHLLRHRPHVVHTHLKYASLVGISAAFLTGVKSRIHTRHNSSFHNIYHPHAVKYDKLVSRLSTKVVSISKVVTEVLVDWEGTPVEKVIEIPHGFDLDYFRTERKDDVLSLRSKYGLQNHTGPVIGMISRYIHWKGCIYGIEAFKSLLEKYPDAVLILANAQGPDSKEIKETLANLPRRNYIVFLMYLFMFR